MNDSPSMIRAVRGPLILIVLGILFAIDNFMGISFARTWPVLLIVFGIFKLADLAGHKSQ